MNAWPKVLVVVLLLLTVVRVTGQGVFRGTASIVGESSWIGEELRPLINLISRGEPISHIDPRQYGATVFLVMDPALRLAGEDALNVYILVVSLSCVIASFVLVAWRLFRRDAWAACCLAIGWFNFVPLLVGLSARLVDTWQLLFVSLAFVLFASPGRAWFSGVPLAAATLAKIIPIFMLVYVALRERGALLAGSLTGLAILLTAQVLYGSLMGLGYPIVIAMSGIDTTVRFGTHWENDSLRGLIHKVASGFRVQTDPGTNIISGQLMRSDMAGLAEAIAFSIALLVVAHLVLVTWRARAVGGSERRMLEFGMALVVMLLVSPHTSHEHMVTALPAFAVLFGIWRRARPASWPLRRMTLAVAGALLVGVFLPLSVIGQLLQLDRLLAVTGNAQLVPMPAIGAYDLFAFPAVGLVLTWLAFVDLERSFRRTELDSGSPGRT